MVAIWSIEVVTTRRYQSTLTSCPGRSRSSGTNLPRGQLMPRLSWCLSRGRLRSWLSRSRIGTHSTRPRPPPGESSGTPLPWPHLHVCWNVTLGRALLRTPRASNEKCRPDCRFENMALLMPVCAEASGLMKPRFHPIPQVWIGLAQLGAFFTPNA